MNLENGTQIEHIPQMAEKEVPGSRKAAYSRGGPSFGKGEAESSNLSGSTRNPVLSSPFAEFPAGSLEPVHNFRILWIMQ